MIILIWLISLICLVTLGTILLTHASKDPTVLDHLKTSFEGFKDGLRGSGFAFKKKHTVELYQWVLSEKHTACPDCLERSTWKPMDIADWMKHGLPGTPEAHTQCGEDCHCSLVLVKTQTLNNTNP